MKFKWIFLCLLTFFDIAAFATIKRDTISTAEDLMQYFSKKIDSAEVYLKPGTYNLQPKTTVDPACGNCEKINTPVDISYGLQLSGKYIRLIGLKNISAKIITNAGYGIFINNCDFCEVRNLDISGGERNKNGNATDAGIVVKNSYGIIENNFIHDNIGDSAVLAETVVGIAGIAMREKAHFRILNNRIIRNSWDGIAFYRDSRGLVTRNLIDGVDKATGKTAGGGRGVGIGLTHNAKVNITYNLVKRYWKGIGVFVNAEGTVKGNIVEDILTWGIALWDAGSGQPYGAIKGNVVYNTGACGVSISSNSKKIPTGSVTDNYVIQTGLNEKYDSPEAYCFQCPISLHQVPKDFVIKDNILYRNRIVHEEEPLVELSEDEFLENIDKAAFNTRFFLWWHKSDFMRDYVRID